MNRDEENFDGCLSRVLLILTLCAVIAFIIFH